MEGFDRHRHPSSITGGHVDGGGQDLAGKQRAIKRRRRQARTTGIGPREGCGDGHGNDVIARDDRSGGQVARRLPRGHGVVVSRKEACADEHGDDDECDTGQDARIAPPGTAGAAHGRGGLHARRGTIGWGVPIEHGENTGHSGSSGGFLRTRTTIRSSQRRIAVAASPITARARSASGGPRHPQGRFCGRFAPPGDATIGPCRDSSPSLT